MYDQIGRRLLKETASHISHFSRNLRVFTYSFTERWIEKNVASLRSSIKEPHTLVMYSGAGSSMSGFSMENATADSNSCFFNGRFEKASQPTMHLI